MRVVVQRVAQASVEVEGQVVGQVGPGMLALVGFRAGDDEGRLPANPAAIQLGLAPLRFASRSSKAWVSFLATRYGWTFAEGRSSMVLTISAVELGRTF